MDVSRRNFLKGAAAGTAGAALAGGVLIGGARADGGPSDGDGNTESYPFHGLNQAGVLTPGPAASRPSPASPRSTSWRQPRPAWPTCSTVTRRSRFLTADGIPPNLGVGHPPADSDVLGPAVPADGLTVTLSAGRPFDDRYGLAASKPRSSSR